MDIDSFDMDDSLEEELAKKAEEFIDNQEEVEVVNECESGACAI